MLKAVGVEPHSVQRDRASAPVILLKDKADHLIRYDPADEWVAQQADDLRAYNALIAAQDISLPGWTGTSRSTDLTRIYNGGWDRGGRHFGGWWQGVPSKQRPGILINGTATTELDYGGFFPRALYHLAGQEMPGDPYDIPEVRHLIEGWGLAWEAGGRKAIKRLVNIAISARSKNAFLTEESIEQLGLPKELIRQCVPLMIKHHHPIKGRLLKGASLGLMNLESDICQSIICSGLKDGVVILPIFDSFIATSAEAGYLRQRMVSEYQSRLGYAPEVH